MGELYYGDPLVKIYRGNTMEVLKELPSESIDCIVTSPPYWGLRCYEGEQDLVWDSLIAWCEHQWEVCPPRRPRSVNDIKNPESKQATVRGSAYEASDGNTCPICGAWRGAFGLEPTPELYLQHTLEFFREIKRVLKKTGVVFYNIGDTYMGGGMGHSNQSAEEFMKAYPKQGSVKAMTTPEERLILSSLRKKHPII